jgi:hypothetical protein
MSNAGRPQVLNDSKKNSVLALLTVGCSRTTAAHYVNCDPKTIYNTARRDPEFAEKLARAENTSEFTHLTRIFKAGKEFKNWRSSAWALERMFPDRFGARSPDSVTPKQLALFINRLMEMLVEEIPVAKYRKNVLARLDRMIKEDEFPDSDSRGCPLNPTGKNPLRITANIPQ